MVPLYSLENLGNDSSNNLIANFRLWCSVLVIIKYIQNLYLILHKKNFLQLIFYVFLHNFLF